VTMDEEGGGVDRLGNNNLAPPLPSAQNMAATGNPQFAYNEGVTAAKEMLAKYKVPMPNQNVTEAEIRDYLAYFRWADANVPPQRGASK